MRSKKFDTEYSREMKAKYRETEKMLGEMYRHDQTGGISFTEFKKMMKASYPKQ